MQEERATEGRQRQGPAREAEPRGFHSDMLSSSCLANILVEMLSGDVFPHLKHRGGVSA